MSEFPLNIENKEDYPDKVNSLSGVDSKYYESAEEKNKKTRALTELNQRLTTEEQKDFTGGVYSVKNKSLDPNNPLDSFLPFQGELNVSYKVRNDFSSSENNGYWFWNGTVYEQETLLVNGVIEEGNQDAVNGGDVYVALIKKTDKTNSINLFDANDIIEGTYISTGSGNLANPGGNYTVSQWIAIDENKKYIIQGRNTAFGDNGTRYKNAVGTILRPLENDDATERTNYDMPNANGRLMIPTGATHVQFTVKFNVATMPAEIMLVESDNFVEWYEPYNKVIKDEQIGLRREVSPSNNKTVGSTALSNYLKDNEDILQKIVPSYNLINDEFANAGTGNPQALAGSQRTDWIKINPENIYYVKGRVQNGGIVFRDSSGNKIKPIDENGVTQDYYWLNYYNGRLYIPNGAVEVMITSIYNLPLFETFEFYYVKFRADLKNTSSGVKLFIPKYIETYVGDTIQLFKYSMINAFNPKNYNIQVLSNKVDGVGFAGDDYPRYWQYTTVAEEEINLTFELYDNEGNFIDVKQSVLKIKNNNTQPSSNINVLMVGDSLTFYNRIPDEFKRVLTSNDAFSNNYNDLLNGNTVIKPAGKNYSNITLVGTQLINYIGWTGQEKHEGYSGRTWDYFVNNNGSPFTNNGSLDFANYLTTNSISSIDVMYIGLAWNDIVKTMTSNSDVASLTPDILTFLRAVHTQLPNCKIYLWSENFPSMLGGVGNHPYGSDSRTNEHNWKIRLQNIYEEYDRIANLTEFSSYVKFISSHLMYDAENMNQWGTAIKNNRITNTEVRGTDDVHPSDGGFFQIADALIRSFIYNHLT